MDENSLAFFVVESYPTLIELADLSENNSVVEIS